MAVVDVYKVFAYFAVWIAEFFGLYALLSGPLQIAAFSGVAFGLWSVVRFIVLPILGGMYSINDNDGDILTETVTETTSTADPVQRSGGKTRRHTVTHTKSRTSRRREKRK